MSSLCRSVALQQTLLNKLDYSDKAVHGSSFSRTRNMKAQTPKVLFLKSLVRGTVS